MRRGGRRGLAQSVHWLNESSIHQQETNQVSTESVNEKAVRVHVDGFGEEMLNEASKTVAKLFGDWPLYGSKDGYGEHDMKTAAYVFGSLFTRGHLDLKTRSLLILAGLCVLQREPLIRIWTNASLNVGWTEAQIKEMGMLVAHIGGFPTSRGSVLVFDDVLEKRRANPDAKWV